MAPLWHKALPKAHMYIYILDTSNPWQLGVAIVLLMETLVQESTADKPILLFFNKTDIIEQSTTSLEECKSLCRISDLAEKYKNLFSVVDGSCVTCEGMEGILKWVTENRAKQD